MEHLEDINKIIELDIESEIQPNPEDLAAIFEAVVVKENVKEKVLRQYLYTTEPTLSDISRALEMVAEGQRSEMETASYKAITEGIKILQSKEKPVLPEEELHKIYDKLTELLENIHPEKRNFGKILMNSLLIVGGGIIATATLPHLIEEREKYSDQMHELLNWFKNLFHSKTK